VPGKRFTSVNMVYLFMETKFTFLEMIWIKEKARAMPSVSGPAVAHLVVVWTIVPG
jgi:hypothetical protein